jgi:uncharacterized LabA/DUF88 family protein
MKKVIVFVDANNWYHNVKKYKKPGEVDIQKIANLLCEVKKFKLVEIRWYASVPDISDGEVNYYKHLSFLEGLEKNGVKVITRKLQRFSHEEIQKKKKEIIKGLDLCDSCRPQIEAEFLDLADIKKKEKGIDVWCAVDMIKCCLMDGECDACILISGDADFVPALNILKEKKKDILVAMVPSGFSKELRDNFEYFIVKRETLNNCLRDWEEVKKESKIFKKKTDDEIPSDEEINGIVGGCRR